MKTKEIKVYVYAQQSFGTKTIEVTTDAYLTTYTCGITGMTNTPIIEILVNVPDLSGEQLDEILQNATLNNLIAEQARLRELNQEKLDKLDKQIANLRGEL